MKITKSQLKQIIKEELDGLQERESINHPITYAHKQYVETLMDLFHEQLGTPMNKKLPEDVGQALNALNQMLYRYVEAAATK